IDGEFHGKVRTKGKVLIGKNGIAECQIFAGTVVIGGKVTGDIFAIERVILLSTGELIGNIKTPRIVIEEGVIFEGTCEIIEDRNKFETVKRAFIEEFFTGGEFYKKNNLYINQVSDENNIKDSIESKDEAAINDSIDFKGDAKKLKKDLERDFIQKKNVKTEQKV
ncbi:MAG TPA: polymer-forming cytoskeletal protein, partial [candidate division WOR-3 bacterium]|nr:polymer-forming cytoskeletal protein [candidate division WOR-3 bacterium]